MSEYERLIEIVAAAMFQALPTNDKAFVTEDCKYDPNYKGVEYEMPRRALDAILNADPYLLEVLIAERDADL